ncbi:MAG: hypothetical protein AAF957_19885 [Planctomycetota bacterium]
MVASLVLAWFVLDSESSPVQQGGADVATKRPADREQQADPDLGDLVPSSRVAVPEPRMEAVAPESAPSQGPSAAATRPVERISFEEKYADATAAELAGIASQLNLELIDEIDAAADQLFQLGEVQSASIQLDERPARDAGSGEHRDRARGEGARLAGDQGGADRRGRHDPRDRLHHRSGSPGAVQEAG